MRVSKKVGDSVDQGVLLKQAVPQMPEGYYSGDKPNPKLRAFVEAHVAEKPYDPETDDYDVPAFSTPIETTKATAIYNMHTYWSKKPHDAIGQYIRHYTQPGDLVLDPFCGSGGTALAALMEGRKAIAIDRSPAATFITKNYCTPMDTAKLRVAFEGLKKKVKPEIDWLYETRCDRCGGKATTAYTVYSQVFKCPRCLQDVPLFDCPEVKTTTKAGKPKNINVCPHCREKGVTEEISTRSKRQGAVPVLVSYRCQNGCKPSRGQRVHNDKDAKKRQYFEEYDLGKLAEIESKKIPYWFPTDRMMHADADEARWGLLWRPYHGSISRVCDFYTKRNLWALAAALSACRASSLEAELLFVFQSNTLSGTNMQQFREGGGGFAKGTYYVPQIFVEREQMGCLQRKLSDVLAAQPHLSAICTSQPTYISTQSATNLAAIPASAVDYIFTDPPYSWKVQYGESNFIWEAWLGFDTHWHDEEIIVNEVRGKTETDWAKMMRQAMAECYRVLKPGHWISLCYHDTSEGTWSLIQDIMAEVGFAGDCSGSAVFIDAEQKAWKQLVADKVNKRDLVINFRKPKPGEAAAALTISGDEDATTFNDKVRAIVGDYLLAHPGATKDRVYDELVSHMVRAGQMEPHNFDELISQVAEEVKQVEGESGRWYLKEAEAQAFDAAESAKEDAAAQAVAGYIAKCLREHPEDLGVHYSDIFEHYIYSVPVTDKPRRSLGEWLADYFYNTEDGTYRLPESEEEERLKREGRASGTSRQVKRYVSYLQQGLSVPAGERPSDATLAEWIRHCKRSGMYDQGKLLYEQGGLDLEKLPEEMMVGVEEDYQTCTRMLGRAELAPSRKKAQDQRSLDL